MQHENTDKQDNSKQFASANLDELDTKISGANGNYYNGSTNRHATNGQKGTNITDISNLAALHRVNLLEVLPPPPIAMKILSNGEEIALFTKGNFSIVTGFAKSRKSFLISMLMASACAREEMTKIFRCCGTGVNILFDTEQSKYKVQQIMKRIKALCPNLTDKNFLCYSLRTLSPAERLAIIDEVLANTHNINFVALDGIIDLEIDPILQADQANKIIQRLMLWTDTYNIHITCVLHYNKSVASLLGHLGSFAHRKADAIIEVAKDKENKENSIVTAIDCREREFEPFAFTIDGDGLPYILDNYEISTSTPKRPKQAAKKATYLDFDTDEHIKIVGEVFGIIENVDYTTLWQKIKIVAGRIAGNSIGDNKAKDFVNYYVTTGILTKKDLPKNKTEYHLP